MAACFIVNLIEPISDPSSNAKYQYQHGQQRDTQTGTSSDLGFRCVDVNGNPVTPDGRPIVITVTQQDFANLPLQPATAHAGPPSGDLPVSMDLVVYAEGPVQTLDTSLLGTPVRIRATPLTYTWDFGDGNQLSTSRPGRAYPHKDLTHRYQHEGWYDVTLTTTYAGQFSINGGPWQDIDGTVTVASPAIPLYSRSYESRLTDPHHSDDDAQNSDTDTPPPRTPENNGLADAHARHRHDS